MATDGQVNGLRYGRAIRQRWPLVVVLTLVGLAIGYLTAKPAHAANPLVAPSTQSSQYSATALLMPVAAGSSAGQADPSGLSITAMAYFATTGDVPRMVASQLRYRGNPANLASQVSVTTNPTVGVIQISATEPTGPEAVKLVDAFDVQLIAYLNDQIRASYHRQRTAAAAQLSGISRRIATLQAGPSSSLVQAEVAALQSLYRTDAAQYAQLQGVPPKTTLTVIQPPVAEPGSAPVVGTSGTSGTANTSATTATSVASSSSTSSHSTIPKSRLVRTLLGGIVGFLVGLALALLLDRFDTRLYGIDEIEDAFGLPVLADIRTAGADEPVVARAPMSPAAEGYRMLQASVASEPVESDDAWVVLVAPVRLAAGGSLVAANLAASFRDAGNRVAVVTSEPAGWLARLSPDGIGARGAPRAGRRAGAPAAQGIQVLVSEGDSPGARTTRMVELIDGARSAFDVIIVDAAPLLVAHEATRLAPSSNTVVLVAAGGRDRADDARRALSLFRLVEAPVAGLAVLRWGRRVRPGGRPGPGGGREGADRATDPTGELQPTPLVADPATAGPAEAGRS